MLLGCQYLGWILFLGVVSVLAQPPTDLPRQYLARRDFFRLFKAAEFSITDPLQKELYYRIESRFHPLQRVEVIRYPEKVKTARLASKLHMVLYHGEFSISEQNDKPMDRRCDRTAQSMASIHIRHSMERTSDQHDQHGRWLDFSISR